MAGYLSTLDGSNTEMLLPAADCSTLHGWFTVFVHAGRKGYRYAINVDYDGKTSKLSILSLKNVHMLGREKKG